MRNQKLIKPNTSHNPGPSVDDELKRLVDSLSNIEEKLYDIIGDEGDDFGIDELLESEAAHDKLIPDEPEETAPTQAAEAAESQPPEPATGAAEPSASEELAEDKVNQLEAADDECNKKAADAWNNALTVIVLAEKLIKDAKEVIRNLKVKYSKILVDTDEDIDPLKSDDYD